MSSIHILVLNYNGLDLLQLCLPSVAAAAAASPVPTRLSVVDNASVDGSRRWVAETLPQVGWIQMPDNTVLYAYNRVAADPAVEGELLLLLNNDIKVEPDFIAPLLKALQRESAAFAAAPRYLDFEGAYNGGMHRCGRSFSVAWAGPIYPGAEAESRRAGVTLYNANGLFRRDKLLALGGFDRLFRPLGWEDTDLCCRAWARGWPTLYEPASLIHHKSSASLRRHYSEHRRHALGYRNSVLWLAANAPLGQALAALAWAPLAVPAYLITGRWAQAQGFLWSLGRLPQALARRCGTHRGWWDRFTGPAAADPDQAGG